MKAWVNPTPEGTHYILEVPKAQKTEIKLLMAYRGLTFSTSASSPEKAVLFSDNPYSIADLIAPDDPHIGGYRRAIDASRAITSSTKYRTPPSKELWEYQAADL